jgi:hypothetical protein
MKQVLLLAAIYSLVIHQSQKKNREMVPPVKITLSKAAELAVKLYKQNSPSRSFGYDGPAYINYPIASRSSDHDIE